MTDQTGFEFLVLEKDHLVAADMQGGLAAALPGCTVTHVLDPCDVVAHLQGWDESSRRQLVLVTKLTFSQMEELGLDQLVASANAKLVLRQGDDPVEAATARGWFCLPSPFVEEDLRALADHLLHQSAAA